MKTGHACITEIRSHQISKFFPSTSSTLPSSVGNPSLPLPNHSCLSDTRLSYYRVGERITDLIFGRQTRKFPVLTWTPISVSLTPSL